MDKQLQAYYEEAYELLHELEQFLLDLDNSPDNFDIVASVLRILHTLKGTSAMFGFNHISDFVHKIESVFVHFKNCRQQVDKDFINAAISAADAIKRSLNEKSSDLSDSAEVLHLVHEQFEKFHGGAADSVPSAAQTHENLEKDEENRANDLPLRYWQIKFSPCREFYQSGNSPDRIIAELADLGKCEVEASCAAIPRFEEIDPELNYLSWQIKLATSADLNEIRDVFIFVEDLARIEIKEISTPEILPPPENEVQPPTAITEDAEKNNAADPTVDASSFMELPKGSIADDSAFLRENTEKMIALLGDLVTVQAKLNQKAAFQGEPELISISNELENITDELRDCAMHLSMFPIGMLFKLFQNAVENASGGKVKLNMAGAMVEIDRSAHLVVKQNLTHLLRKLALNLKESSEVTPAISLKARHQVGKALIEITADADEAIIQRLCESAENQFAEIFTSLGHELQMLSGSINLQRKDEISLGLVISLPLNLAIIESLIVKIGVGYFLLPLADIEECIELSEEDQRKSYRKNVAVVRGQFVPYLHLREKFSITGKPPAVQQIVILKLDQQRIGMVVDQVVGEYQTAIKTWGKFCNDVAGISGAAILGDGGIALLIDFKALIEEEKELLERNLKEHQYGI